MESWSCFGLEGKDLLLSDEMEIPIDSFTRTRKPFLELDNKTCFDFGKESVEGMDLIELEFPDMGRKPIHGNQGVDILSGVDCNDSSNNTSASPTGMISLSPDMGRKPIHGNQGVDILSGVDCNDSSSNTSPSPTGMISLSSSWGEGESGSKLSSPFTKYISQESPNSSLISLKLGRLAESKHGQCNQYLKERSKRARTKGSNYQTPTCQVHGCNMDLTSSKDYHKKHRVCDAHSKTAVVIVDGIEQRFCQQCSRFHLLAEFDDVKRSCRRRLAGHNQRRRKPQLNGFNYKSHEWLQSYQGTGYPGTSLPRITPFVFSGILPGCILYPKESNQYKHINAENESTYSQSVTPITNRQLVPNSFLHLHDLGKQHASTVSSSGNKYSVFDTSSSFYRASRDLNYRGAFSLLSSQSPQNFSSHSAKSQVASPLIMHRTHHSLGELHEMPSAVKSLGTCERNRSFPCLRNPIGTNLMESALISESSHAHDFQLQTDSALQESDSFSNKSHISMEHGPTFDLLQLSSHFQRVEQERIFLQVKQEQEEVYCFPRS